ncbi:unnamed protein product [Protopolystoma xenopodis]|uniref:Uncharacterized protein n=1 Tax=Protopolystoma xenopodis TaxID=117903 RepID=A0A3S5C6M3_9PLAT|nr:unnamed protein product [Protopolystoma xenopodis]
MRSRTPARQTALMLAARHGAAQIVALLLACRANVNLQDASGNTALMCAAEHGHTQVACHLLARPELDLTLRDNDGKDPMEVAKSAKQDAIVELIRQRIEHGHISDL